MDLNKVKDHYQSLPDFKIERLALEEAASLEPAVIQILKNEVVRRSLGEELLKGIDVQINGLTDQELEGYCEMLRTHPCPKCNSKINPLQVSMIGEVVSVIFFTNYDKKMKVACAACQAEWNTKANTKSALLGWWGFPWGPIQTVRSFIFNSTMKKVNNEEATSELFLSFVASNHGIFEAAKSNPERLTHFLRKMNE